MTDVVAMAHEAGKPLEAFWAAISQKMAEVKAMKVGDGTGEYSSLHDPARNWVWITEQRSWKHNIQTEGTMVCEAALKLACQRIVEGTHKLADTALIRRELKSREERRTAILAAQASNDKKRIVLTSPSQIPPVTA